MAQQVDPARDHRVLKDTYCGSIGVEYIHIQDRETRRWLQAEMEPNRNRRKSTASKRLRILRQLMDAELFESFIHSRYQGQKTFLPRRRRGPDSRTAPVHRDRGDGGADEVVIGMAHRGRLNVLANILHKPY